MLAEVCEEDGDVETDFFGGVQEGGGELSVVNVAFMVSLAAHQQEVDLVCGVPSIGLLTTRGVIGQCPIIFSFPFPIFFDLKKFFIDLGS